MRIGVTLHMRIIIRIRDNLLQLRYNIFNYSGIGVFIYRYACSCMGNEYDTYTVLYSRFINNFLNLPVDIDEFDPLVCPD